MKRLFLDDSTVELRESVERRWHQPVKHGPPVLAPEGAAEQFRLHIWNPPLSAEDAEGWRMWYIGGEDLHPLHARSEDGIEWRRQDNRVDLGFDADRKERRLVLCRPDTETMRYRALTRVGSRLRPLESADGLNWRYHADHPGIPSDDEYRLGYDEETGRLIATVKLGGRHGRARLSVPEYGRAVALSTSTDGLDWTEPEMIFHADRLDREAGAEAVERHLADDDLRSPLSVHPEYAWTDVYNMPVFRYEGLYLALPVLFHQCGVWQHPGRPEGANQDGLLWPALAWSEDMREWTRPERREAFIPLSPLGEEAVCDNGAIHACAPVRRGDELWFYYYGSRFSHVSPAVLREQGLLENGAPIGAIFLAKLRLDGFSSLHAGDEPGAILTRPIPADGVTLRINAAARDGEVRAEIRDAESGRAIAGLSMGDRLNSRTITFGDGRVEPRLTGWGARFEDDVESDDSVAFSGDSVDAVVHWRGGADLSALRGRMVRVLFRLRNADLYSFWFGDA